MDTYVGYISLQIYPYIYVEGKSICVHREGKRNMIYISTWWYVCMYMYMHSDIHIFVIDIYSTYTYRRKIWLCTPEIQCTIRPGTAPHWADVCILYNVYAFRYAYICRNKIRLCVPGRLKMLYKRRVGPVRSKDKKPYPPPPPSQFSSHFHERCAKCWIEWKINFPIFIFRIIVKIHRNLAILSQKWP